MMVIDDKIKMARQILLSQIDFDLYASPMFIEAFICKFCGFTQTKKQVSYDAISKEGFRIEIKHSALILSKVASKGKYFAFSNLQGTTRKGKNADVYILVGYDEEQLRYFVIPANVIRKRHNLTIQIQDRLYRNTRKWLNYEVSPPLLCEAVKNRGEENKNPSPLFPTTL